MLGTPSRRCRRHWRCTVPGSRAARTPPSVPSPRASCEPRTGAARWRTPPRRPRRHSASRRTAASRATSSGRGRPPTKCGGGWCLVRLMSRQTLPGR
uniref:Uncharacterized protein n=1 Tax=Arundo donax TaxID=35708 RepID=A0A0A9H687_ARUDO